MRILSLIFLGFVLLSAGYLGYRIHNGLKFQTDLMALLPREQQDKDLQRAHDKVTDAFSKRVIILVGNKDRDKARSIASTLQQELSATGLIDINTNLDNDRLTEMGKIYFPYRFNLLTDAERKSTPQEISTRALSQVYGLFGMANAQLLENDPFLLLPTFFTSLPLPMSKLTLDEGMLSTKQDDKTWIMVGGSLVGNPYALETQEQFIAKCNQITSKYPDTEILKLGAVFFAHEGAKSAMTETSLIGIFSTIGTILLVYFVFRATRPLFLNLLVIVVGILVATSVSLIIFGELHVSAMLFGVSLIGIAVDYGLQYCTEIFAPGEDTPEQRMRHVLPGITLGMITTIIGYLTLLFAPLPGLYQIAAFSVIGLIAAWLTVYLWFPILDNSKKPTHGANMMRWANEFGNFWNKPRWVLIGALVTLSTAGATKFHFDDDVRRMQSLNSSLVKEQNKIQELIGNSGGTQFFILHADDEETLLQRQEQLVEKLHPLTGKALTGFQSPAQYVPSLKRQQENWQISKKLYADQLSQHIKALSLNKTPIAPGEFKALRMEDVSNLSFLSPLILDKNTHVVMLDKVTDLAAVKSVGEGIEGVKLVDPAGDFSSLLEKYRNRTIILMILSTLFMLPLVFWRYGLIGGIVVKLPAVIAVIITPLLSALLGNGFTFFDAIALLLVLSMGVDYAIFCAESEGERKPATLIGVVMSGITAMLSFGLLAFSEMLAVHNFGLTMLIGILLSLLFAPLAKKYKK